MPSKHYKEFCQDLKKVYQASNAETADFELELLAEKWGKYHMAIKPWKANWQHLTTFFKFSSEIRRMIYTTNPIEGYHRQVRKYTKAKGAFTSENALLKQIYCAIKNVTKKWSQPMHNWATIISELDIHFPDRIIG